MIFALKTFDDMGNEFISIKPFTQVNETIYQFLRDIDFCRKIEINKPYKICLIQYESINDFNIRNKYTNICTFTFIISDNQYIVHQDILVNYKKYKLTLDVNVVKKYNKEYVAYYEYLISFPQLEIN